MHPLRLAVQIAGRSVPLLPFPLVHVGLDRVAVGASERRVDIDHRLHPVVAGGDLRDRRERSAARGGVDDRGRARRQAVDVDAEHRLRREAAAHLEPRLAVVLPRHDQQHAPVERRRTDVGEIDDVEPQRRRS